MLMRFCNINLEDDTTIVACITRIYTVVAECKEKVRSHDPCASVEFQMSVYHQYVYGVWEPDI